MSFYYDKTSGFYVVRSYIRGNYKYIGRRSTKEEAEELDNTWKAEMEKQVGDGVEHTTEWFEAQSKAQAASLYMKYPPYTTTGGLGNARSAK